MRPPCMLYAVERACLSAIRSLQRGRGRCRFTAARQSATRPLLRTWALLRGTTSWAANPAALMPCCTATWPSTSALPQPPQSCGPRSASSPWPAYLYTEDTKTAFGC